MKDKLRELVDELMSACEMIGYATSGNERANHRATRDKIKAEILAILDAEGDGEAVAEVVEAANVPDGYVLTPIDERTGICTDAQRWLLKRDLDAMISFHMQCDDMDADGYTATASEMARLAEIGVVRKVRGAVYEVTSIGCFLCENYWGQNPQLPVMTSKDYNERSAKAMIDAAIQGERHE